MRIFIFLLAFLGSFAFASASTPPVPTPADGYCMNVQHAPVVFTPLVFSLSVEISPSLSSCTWRAPTVNESTDLVVTGIGTFPAEILAVYSGTQSFDFKYYAEGNWKDVYGASYEKWIEVSANNFIVGADIMP